MSDFGYLEALEQVRKDIADQVALQIRKWGIQDRPRDEWMAIFKEEMAEFVCEVVVAKQDGYDEMIHVAAVVEAWLVNIQINRKEQT